MATAAVDTHYLSTYLALPQPSLTTLLDSPTSDLVQQLLQAVAEKAREHDEIKADKLRLEVELENAVRTGESRTRGLKVTVNKGLKEIAELRGKVREEENARSALESELHAIKSSSSSSASDLQSLRSRVASLESSNRDTLSLLESKSTAHDRLAEELSAQHKKAIDLRRDVSNLEQSLQAASSASTSAKFRESSLQQEIELVQRSNEWFESELKTKSAELSKIRKEKGASIAELQRQNEDATSTIESLRRTEATLRTRLTEVAEKADGAFAKTQRLQEDATKEQESFRKELESAQRLAELFEASTNTARERLQDVQTLLDQSKDDAAEELGRAQAETESERSERMAAERRVAELEVQAERLEADLANLQNASPMPGTPRRAANGVSTPTHDGRPSPASTRIKGGLNFTQMYTEYTNAKAELDLERRRNEKLSATIDDMIQDLESKQPEMEELRTEHERLESEVVDMTSLLEEIGHERDKEKKEARKWEGQVEGLQREGDLLRQQLRDLSAQVKVLLSEVHARDHGLDDLDPTERMQLERMARGELDETALEGLTATGRLISQRLTVFKHIEQLQEQNMSLLRVTRELGDSLEGAEARKQQDQQAQDRTELESLRTKVEKYKDEMKTMVTKSQSYIKERDMFRRILRHRGQLAPNADLTSMFGQSLDSSAAMTPSGHMQPLDHPTSARDAADLSRVIKEMQQHFDAYREEATTDHQALKEQSERLSREKGQLQAEIARSSSQLTLARERFDMLQANYNMLQSENTELQKRSSVLSESAAKQDLRTQQVAEELIEAKALVDSMRNETANLKAEKELWKRIEKRLGDDNESLMNERSRLNGLLTSMQNLQNERELSDSETRRKLQGQVDTLDAELQSTKRKLDEEIEDGKKSTLRREYEADQSRKTVDDLRAGLSAVREELVAVKTTKDHLQARVDELTIELKSAEERVQVLQPRPTPRPNANAPSTGAVDNGTLTREQELAVEVSEVRRDLDLARSELENAKVQAEQYRAISQSLEEEIQTHDQYREEMDRVIGDRDSKIQDLERRSQDMTSEMSTANNDLSTLRVEHANNARLAQEEKAQLESEVARLKDEDERHMIAAQSHQEYLKAQAEIAQQAQQNYEDELVKHAEAAKALQKTRSDFNELKTEVVRIKTEAEVAKAALSQNESSWDEMKDRYERELGEMRMRSDNVDAQNKLLHQQLESVTNQISALQRQRGTFATAVEGEASAEAEHASDRSVEELRELVRYIREGKDIVDVQLDLSVREARRLKQQLDYAQSQLDETRLKLDQERRSQADQSRSSMTHKQLVEKINELNLYRESTVTLRNEARQAQAQLAEKTKKVEELIEQMQPLKATIQELENEKETQKGEMKLLQEDRDRYQQRNQNILQKYDRVDPAEMEALREQIGALQSERDRLMAEKEDWAPLQEQVGGIPEQIRRAQEEVSAQWAERRDKMTAQFKERSRTLTNARNEKVAEALALTKEKEELERQLSSLRRELEPAQADRDQIASAVAPAPLQPQDPDTTMQNGVNEARASEAPTDSLNEPIQALQQRLAEKEARIEAAESNAQRLQETIDSQRNRIAELEQQVVELQQKLGAANAELAKVQASSQQAPGPQIATSTEELETLQRNLTEAQAEVDELKTDAAMHVSIAKAATDEEGKTVQQHVEEIRADLEARHAERVKTLEEQYKRKADGMRAQMNKHLRESKEQLREQAREQIRQQSAAEQKEAIAQLTMAHQQELQSLNAKHKDEMEQATQNASQTTASDGIKGEATAPPLDKPISEWVLSDAQARQLVGTNVTLKSILRNNIATQTKKIREDQEEALRDRLNQAQSKCDKEKEQAVAMAEQRQKVKLSMAEGKARTLVAKVDIVQKAATETPQRPVVEVWEVASAVKSAPISMPRPAGTAQVQKPAQSSPTGQQPTQIRTGAALQSGTLGQPTPLAQQQGPQGSQSTGQALTQSASTTAATPPAQTQAAAAPSTSDSPAAAPANVSQQQTTVNGRQGTDSSLPARPPSAGTGPGALKDLIGQGQSAIPRGGAMAGRGARGGRGGQGAGSQNQVQNQTQTQTQRGGSSLPRAPRGRGQPGRDGAQAVPNSNLPQAQSQNSPGGRGGLNAGARQFVPGGNKRAREDGPGDAGEAGNAGKRARGGGGGGGGGRGRGGAK